MSANGGSGGKSPVEREFVAPLPSELEETKDKRRSVTFGRGSVELVRRSLDERPRIGDVGGNPTGKGFRGRLRALTVGRERYGGMEPYEGT